MRARRTVRCWLGALLLTALVAQRRWHTRWGATAAEQAETLPGDEFPVSSFGMRATRSLTVDAPPHHVWPWIVQLGTGKAGWYSYDLLDNLGRPSAEEILTEWQHVAVVDSAAPMDPRGPVEASPWRVAEVRPHEALVWRHPQSGTWAWVLRELPDGRTRLVTRLRTSYAYPGGLVFAPILELADFPMYRKMLLGIKVRAERLAGRPAAV